MHGLIRPTGDKGTEADNGALVDKNVKSALGSRKGYLRVANLDIRRGVLANGMAHLSIVGCDF